MKCLEMGGILFGDRPGAGCRGVKRPRLIITRGTGDQDVWRIPLQRDYPRFLPVAPMARAGLGCAAAGDRLGFAAAFGGVLPARMSSMVMRVVI